LKGYIVEYRNLSPGVSIDKRSKVVEEDSFDRMRMKIEEICVKKKEQTEVGMRS